MIFEGVGVQVFCSACSHSVAPRRPFGPPLPCHLSPFLTSASIKDLGWQVRELGHVQGWGPLCFGPGWLSGLEGAREPTTETGTTGNSPKQDLLKGMCLKPLQQEGAESHMHAAIPSKITKVLKRNILERTVSK